MDALGSSSSLMYQESPGGHFTTATGPVTSIETNVSSQTVSRKQCQLALQPQTTTLQASPCTIYTNHFYMPHGSRPQYTVSNTGNKPMPQPHDLASHVTQSLDPARSYIAQFMHDMQSSKMSTSGNAGTDISSIAVPLSPYQPPGSPAQNKEFLPVSSNAPVLQLPTGNPGHLRSVVSSTAVVTKKEPGTYQSQESGDFTSYCIEKSINEAVSSSSQRSSSQQPYTKPGSGHKPQLAGFPSDGGCHDDSVEEPPQKPTTSEKTCVCLICYKPFRNKPQLTQHELVHSGLRKHTCSFCDKSFKQLCHLQQHVRIHTGERPYRCTVESCGRSFAQLSNLQHHLRNHDDHVRRDNAKQFRCEICDRSYTTESSLFAHSQKLHVHIKREGLSTTSEPPDTKKKKRRKKMAEEPSHLQRTPSTACDVTSISEYKTSAAPLRNVQNVSSTTGFAPEISPASTTVDQPRTRGVRVPVIHVSGVYSVGANLQTPAMQCPQTDHCGQVRSVSQSDAVSAGQFGIHQQPSRQSQGIFTSEMTNQQPAVTPTVAMGTIGQSFVGGSSCLYTKQGGVQTVHHWPSYVSAEQTVTSQSAEERQASGGGTCSTVGAVTSTSQSQRKGVF